MKKEHVPKRMCVVCRKIIPKKDLLRFVKSRKGNMIFDANQKTEGRGMYLCNESVCLKAFASGKKFRKRYHPLINENSLKELFESLGIDFLEKS